MPQVNGQPVTEENKVAEGAVRTDVAKVDSTTGELHPLAAQSNYEAFPVDVYVDAGVIAYHVADLPPSKFADNNDPIPSVRFLFQSLENTKCRKWTKWYRISYHAKAALPKLFTGISGIADILTNDTKLFNQSFKILLESKDGQYSEIIRVKGNDKPVDTLLYDAEFVPYKHVKAYGNLVNLRLAVLKTAEGIKQLSPDDMADAPVDEAQS